MLVPIQRELISLWMVVIRVDKRKFHIYFPARTKNFSTVFTATYRRVYPEVAVIVWYCHALLAYQSID